MARTPLPPNEKRVFINVPFDDEYAPLFQALLFTIEGCGFSSCCALEEPGNAKPRLLKIFNLIEEAALSIHDLSRTKLDKKTRLPRFNMPLELGICLGYRHLDIKGAKKRDCLIFEQTPYKHQQFISDLAGNDIVSHENNPEKIILNVRNFLDKYSSLPPPLGEEICKKYNQFGIDLSSYVQKNNIKQLDFGILSEFIQYWWDLPNR